MPSEVIKGHTGHLKISKSPFSAINFLKLFKNVNITKTQIFHKMKYDLKSHPMS